jgi:serine/threonine protein kinase
MKSKLATSRYGHVQLGVALRRRPDRDVANDGVLWESTDEFVAIKRSSLHQAQAALAQPLSTDGRPHSEKCPSSCNGRVMGSKARTPTTNDVVPSPSAAIDPFREAAALQYTGSECSSILGCLEVLQDGQYLYTVMQYCSRGGLYGRILSSKPLPEAPLHQRVGSTGSSATAASTATSESASPPQARSSPTPLTPARRPSEFQAKVWFRQLVDALLHLQTIGVCHGNISFGSLMVDSVGDLVLIDFGRAMRVPYRSEAMSTMLSAWYGCGGGYTPADVSAGTTRLLVQQTPVSSLQFDDERSGLQCVAPELIRKDPFFDAFAVDLWAAGVVLFVMLVGRAPFHLAHPSDNRYLQICCHGRLEHVAKELDIALSDDATDLLQGMLRSEPSRRFSLAEVMEHPFLTGAHRKVRFATDPLIRRSNSALPAYKKTDQLSNKKRPMKTVLRRGILRQGGIQGNKGPLMTSARKPGMLAHHEERAQNGGELKRQTSSPALPDRNAVRPVPLTRIASF